MVVNVDPEDDRDYVRVNLNFDNSRAWYWVVVAYDSEGLASDPSYEISNANQTPIEISLSQQSLNENEFIGTLVGAFETVDPDIGNSHIYTLRAGTGDDDNSSFTIEGSNLLTSESFNYEEKGSYSILVQTDDQNRDYGGNSLYEKAFTITINDVNDAPTDITLSNNSVYENQPAGATVAALSTTDQDTGQTYLYDLVEGLGASDNAFFTVSGDELQTTASLNFETKSTYNIRVQTDDQHGGKFEEKFIITFKVSDGTVDSTLSTVRITVTAINDAPLISGSPVTDIDENSPYSFTPEAADIDQDLLTFSINRLPFWANFDAGSGRLSGTPGSSDVGIFEGIVITVTDGNASAFLPPFDLTVVNVSTDLSVQQTVDNPTPSFNDTVVITNLVTNNDPNPASNVYVTTILPSGLTYISDDSGGKYDPAGGRWRIGGIPAGSEGNTAVLNIVAAVNRAGELLNIASAADSELVDLNPADNSSAVILNGEYQSDLGIALSVDNAIPEAGYLISLTVMISNNGLNDAAGVQVIDVLPPGLTYVGDDSGGLYDTDLGLWVVGDLPSGVGQTLNLTARVESADEIINTAMITSDYQMDPDTTNNQASQIINQNAASHGAVADLAIQVAMKQNDLEVGEEVLFTIVGRNLGPDPAGGIITENFLSDGLKLISAHPSSGSYNGQSGEWAIDTIEVGSYAALDIVAEVSAAAVLSNVAGVAHMDAFDPNKANNLDEAFVTGIGADPNLSDTDSDEMPDVWEVIHGLNPLVDDAGADLDNDGYTNLQEYLYRTQPNDDSSKPRPPTANAGPDQRVDEGVTVTLYGSNSSDPNNDIVEYYWLQTGGEPVDLSSPYAVQPTFAAPQVGPGGEPFIFQLTVTDRSDKTDTDDSVVNVTWDNDPPTADAGEVQTVDEGVLVTLDGSGSTDPDDGIQNYRWTQTAGIPIHLIDDNTAKPTFVSPIVDSDGIFLEFKLHVVDHNGLESTDTCIVNVTWLNDPPTANAGPDQTVAEGSTVALDGSGSTDADDGIEFYFWTQTGGTPVTLSDVTAVQPTFVTPPVDPNGTHLGFLLVVIDRGGLARTDNVRIEVEDNGIDVFSDDVLPTLSATGKNIAIKILDKEGAERGGHLVSFMTVDPESMPDVSDTETIPVNLIYGLVDLKVKVDEVGSTVRVIIHLNEPAPAGYSWFKYQYGPNGGWYDYRDHAEFNAERNEVILTLVDGGIGDDDETANGIIIDPSGLGKAAQSTPAQSTAAESPDAGGGGGGGGGCFISSAGDFGSLSLLSLLGSLSLLSLLAQFNSLRSSSSKN